MAAVFSYFGVLVVNKNLSAHPAFLFYFSPQCHGFSGDIIADRAEHSENLSKMIKKWENSSPPAAGGVCAGTILHDENELLSLSSPGGMCLAQF